MSTTFQKVETGEHLALLASIAAEIWNEYWPAHIGQAQTDYMVRNFQSLEAIERDITEHAYEYWFILSDAPTARSGAEPASGVDKEPASSGDANGCAARDDGDNHLAPQEMRIVGYTGGHVEPETNRFFISKIYLYAHERGKGYASKVIDFYNDLCRTRNLRAMYLTVNKYNELGIRAYLGKGFETIDSVETDIGCGFIMDDYIMERAATK